MLITTVELLPLSSEEFEPGPPKIDAIELARIVDRGIRESGYIDFKKLCIKKGEKVWIIYLDIYSINDDGNLIDACCLAAVTALKVARMPKYDEKKERVIYGEFTNKKLPLTESMPITVTFHKINDKIVVDPIREEEEASVARLSIAVSFTKKGERINALQKGNEAALEEEEIFYMLENAQKKCKELLRLVEKEIK